MGIELAVAGLALSAFGTVKQMQAAKKQDKAQKNAAAEQAKLQKAQAARERQQQVRDAVRKRAVIANNAAVQGIGQSSSAIGGQGSVASELGGNINYINQSEQSNLAIGRYNSQAQSAGNQAATYGSVASLGFSAFQFGYSNYQEQQAATKQYKPITY